MLLAMENLDRLPKKYDEEYVRLHNALHALPDRESKMKIFDYFSQRYLCFDHMWKKRINFVVTPDPPNQQYIKEVLRLKKLAMDHFYSPNYVRQYPSKRYELKHLAQQNRFKHCYRTIYPECIWSICPTNLRGPRFIACCKQLEQYLTFPHSQLHRFYRFHQANSPTPLPSDIREKYEAALRSYEKMVKLGDGQPQKWLEWMEENFEQKHFIDNLEAKLAEHWYLKEIWEYYFQHLKSMDIVELELNLYQRYCRFFVTDEEKRLQYFYLIQQAAERCDVTKWKMDFAEMAIDYDIENYDKNTIKDLLDAKGHLLCDKCYEVKLQKWHEEFNPDETMEDLMMKKKRQAHNCFICYFEEAGGEIECRNLEENKLQQSFAQLDATPIQFSPFIPIRFHNSADPPIPRSIFNYIHNNARHQILTKLYKTCKYFFAEKRFLVCHFIYVSQSYTQSFIQDSCFINIRNFMLSEYKGFCAGISFSLQNIFYPMLMRDALTRLCLCRLKCLVLSGQDLSMAEFNSVIKGGQLEQVELRKINIIKEDESVMSVEELLENLPNVVHFLLRPRPPMFTPETSFRLSTMKRAKKFEAFKLYEIPPAFNRDHLKTFLLKNLLPKAVISVKCDSNSTQQERNFFRRYFEICIQEWEPRYEAPFTVE